jgi:predicted nucleic acid-binding protein
LLAYIVAEDRHHGVASEYFSKIIAGGLTKPVIVSFALQELELGIRAGKILPHGKIAKKENEVASFMNEICDALSLYEMSILPIQCGVFGKAAEIRQKHDLSYYDSLHAAVAYFSDDKTIISTDPKYDDVPGLKRIDPYKMFTLNSWDLLRKRLRRSFERFPNEVVDVRIAEMSLKSEDFMIRTRKCLRMLNQENMI